MAATKIVAEAGAGSGRDCGLATGKRAGASSGR
jgi:hypothetical protein